MTIAPDVPSRFTERTLFAFFALGAYGAVLAGGLVRPGPLAWVYTAQSENSLDAAVLWGRMFRLAPYSFTPFVATVGWTLVGAVLAYLAVRRLFGAFTALAGAAGMIIAGYPGWDAALPNAARFWTTPIACGAWLLTMPLSRATAPLRDWVATRARQRGIKLLWIGLMVFAFFMTAEQLRLGVRGASAGKFPYAENGLPRGFAKDLDDCRRLQHAGQFMWAAESLRQRGVLFDNPLVCLGSHGAAARFICRVGAARPGILSASRPPRLARSGWSLTLGPAGSLDHRWMATPAVAGMRYRNLRGTVDGVDAGDWRQSRWQVQDTHATDAELAGVIDPRAAGKYLWIEIECREGRDADVQATIGGEPLNMVRRALPAGDRVIVRLAAALPAVIAADGEPLLVHAHEPEGMWDIDIFLHEPELPGAGVKK